MNSQIKIDLYSYLSKYFKLMEFTKEPEYSKISELKDTIDSKKSDLVSLQKEITNLTSKYNKLKLYRDKFLENKKKLERVEEEKDNFVKPKANEMEDKKIKTPKIVEVDISNLKDEYEEEDDLEINNLSFYNDEVVGQFNFGDIIDTSQHRHYGFKFIGKNNDIVTTTRSDTVDLEEGITVPIQITKYLKDSVSKYQNLKDSYILAYELPYYDKTVQKYKVNKNQMYEYIFDFEEDEWYLDEISIENFKRTRVELK